MSRKTHTVVGWHGSYVDDRDETAGWAILRLRVILVERPLRPVLVWLSRVLSKNAGNRTTNR